MKDHIESYNKRNQHYHKIVPDQSQQTHHPRSQTRMWTRDTKLNPA